MEKLNIQFISSNFYVKNIENSIIDSTFSSIDVEKILKEELENTVEIQIFYGKKAYNEDFFMKDEKIELALVKGYHVIFIKYLDKTPTFRSRTEEGLFIDDEELAKEIYYAYDSIKKDRVLFAENKIRQELQLKLSTMNISLQNVKKKNQEEEERAHLYKGIERALQNKNFLGNITDEQWEKLKETAKATTDFYFDYFYTRTKTQEIVLDSVLSSTMIDFVITNKISGFLDVQQHLNKDPKVKAILLMYENQALEIRVVDFVSKNPITQDFEVINNSNSMKAISLFKYIGDNLKAWAKKSIEEGNL